MKLFLEKKPLKARLIEPIFGAKQCSGYICSRLLGKLKINVNCGGQTRKQIVLRPQVFDRIILPVSSGLCFPTKIT